VKRSGQRGFTLLEAAIATALTAFIVLAVSAAVLQAMHATSKLAARAALNDDALNVLADLRTATAYDSTALARIVGRSYTTNVVRDGETVSVSVNVTQSGAKAPIEAEVTATDPSGTSATEERQLYLEAPAPGSVIDQPSPAPSASGP